MEEKFNTVYNDIEEQNQNFRRKNLNHKKTNLILKRMLRKYEHCEYELLRSKELLPPNFLRY